MATASRTFVDLEILKNSDFDQSINFDVNYPFITDGVVIKDYELAIAADYSTTAVVTLKSDDVSDSFPEGFKEELINFVNRDIRVEEKTIEKLKAKL